MKALRFLFLFLLIGMDDFTYLYCSCTECTAMDPGSKSAMTLTFKSRKLKDKINSGRWDEDSSGHKNLEDYESVDPVPSSKTCINPAPIQHGAPLMPYIPKPSPPPG